MEQTQQAIAQYQARVQWASEHPREMDAVRKKILAECKRPAFAEAARYSKPVGNGDVATGFTVRFVNEALRMMGNVATESVIAGDDDKLRRVRVLVTDLETSTTFSKELAIEKVIERRSLRANESATAQRQTANGTVYLVRASEDDLSNKEALLSSIVIRQLGLKIIPGELQDECTDVIMETVESAMHTDPEGQRKKLLRLFASLGIKAADLITYVGNPVEKWNTTDLVSLRAIAQSLRDGETNWAAVMQQRKQVRGVSTAEVPQGATQSEKLLGIISQPAAQPTAFMCCAIGAATCGADHAPACAARTKPVPAPKRKPRKAAK